MRAEQASEWSTFCTTFWGKDKLKEPAPGVVVKMRKYEAEKQVPDLGRRGGETHDQTGKRGREVITIPMAVDWKSQQKPRYIYRCRLRDLPCP